jgi:YggT family protein
MAINWIVGQIITLYEIVIIVRIVLTWVPHNAQHPAAAFLYKITEPILAPVRRVIPSIGGIDISPIVVFIGLGFIKRVFG